MRNNKFSMNSIKNKISNELEDRFEKLADNARQAEGSCYLIFYEPEMPKVLKKMNEDGE
ncbi:cyclic lactone autoinducer peptide [Listeria rocourtiae]|uniref:cyclic lactone autoinducer peptide n=1 Tax=Listeria rocourtiae TaxID=647910 RepID=UPI00162575A0|nr:cyclic lactone autoinducer peptide [Listeria rocourtiae]MBC1433816.1 cyclic lactone autoinducer peptide [Listeria rocourtiae]